MYRRLFLIGLLSFFFLTSCNSSFGADQQGGGDYTKVKEITLDVLHTEEGKKALMSLMADPEIQQKMVTTKEDLSNILSKSISDQKTKKDWQKLLTEEQVANQILKATENQQKQLLKTLMKDPEYQKMMLDILKDPQFTQHLIELMNGPTYRKEVMKVLEETMKTPRFQQKVQKLLRQSHKQGGEEEKGDEGKQNEDTSESS